MLKKDAKRKNEKKNMEGNGLKISKGGGNFSIIKPS